MDLTLQATTGLRPDDFTQAEERLFFKALLDKNDMEMSNKTGLDQATADGLRMANKADINKHWERLKFLYVNKANKVINWHTKQRYNGYRSDRTCPCEEHPTLSTQHVLTCQHLHQAFELTQNALRNLGTDLDLKQLLSSPITGEWNQEMSELFEKLIIAEQILALNIVRLIYPNKL